MTSRYPPLLVPLLLVICSGCKSPPSQQEHDSLDTVISWTATIRMAGTAWVHQKVPTPYLKTTLQAAQKEIQSEGETLQKNANSPQSQQLAKRYLQVLAPIFQRISNGVENQNSAAVSRELAALEQQERNLQQLKKTAKNTP